MQISPIKYLQSLPGYSRDLDSALEAATLHGIGHARHDRSYTPSPEEVDKCLAFLQNSDATNDPFSYTLAFFGTAGTVEEQHAAKIYNNHGARLLLLQLHRDLTLGPAAADLPSKQHGSSGMSTYTVMRAWRDGESMQPHQLGGPFDTLEEAKTHANSKGGYVRRDSDGASLAPGGGEEWIAKV